MGKLNKLSKIRKGLDTNPAGNKDIVVLVVFSIAQSACRVTSWMKSICILDVFFMPNQVGKQFKGQMLMNLPCLRREKKDNIFLTAKTPIRGSLEWVVWVSHRHLANNPVDEWSHLWRPQCRAWQSKGVCLKKWTISKKRQVWSYNGVKPWTTQCFARSLWRNGV